MPAMPAESPSELHRQTSPAAAFVALTEAGLHRIEACIDLLLQRDEVEDVHALRVAARHLRAVLWIFGPALPRRVTTRWKPDLRNLAGVASDVRDWDVFLAETLQPALELQPDDPVLAALIGTVRARRGLARETMVARLTEYRHWPLPALHRDLAHLSAHADSGPGQLGKFAPKRVRKARGRLRKLMQAAADGELRTVHRARIAGKRLRYAIEALEPVLPARYTKRLHKKLVKRQGRLGRIVDGNVARRLMAECLMMPEPGQYGWPEAR